MPVSLQSLMAKSPDDVDVHADHDHNRSSPGRVTGEIPVEYQIEIGSDGDESCYETAPSSPQQTDGSSSDISSGFSDRSSPQLKHPETSTANAAEPSSSQHDAKHWISRRKNTLGVLGEKFFDNKISLKKKLKWLNRLAHVRADGTVQFEVPEQIKPQNLDFGTGVTYDEATDNESVDTPDIEDLPPLQIVMLIVGTRGDVQPFVAIGKKFQEYGHRVRLATHLNFKEFVMASGLEFFPLGGDPKALASCHSHVAEALKVPLHIFFTMPWTPTNEFPHPLSRVKQPVGYRLSYQIVDALIWLGMRDIINEFRRKKLKLRRASYLSGSHGPPLEVPFGYIWSPHLVPKPKDWGPKTDVVGFCFLDLASNYIPPDSLVKWLEDGEKPIYIGFGSLPVQKPEKMTQIIVQALEITGRRGIINKGWGGLGNLERPKDFVYLLDNCPHDWLFLRCAAVVHHGGAGTTAAGLRAACPTTVVPFFGDQPFWGDRVHARGVGPTPIPVEEFSLDKLVAAIQYMLDPMVKDRATELAKAMENEDGVTGAVKAFYKHFRPKKLELSEYHHAPRRHSVRRCFGFS